MNFANIRRIWSRILEESLETICFDGVNGNYIVSLIKLKKLRELSEFLVDIDFFMRIEIK